MNSNVYNCLICFNPVTIDIVNVQNSILGYNLKVHSSFHSLFYVKIDLTPVAPVAGTPLESIPGCIFNTSPKLQNIGLSLADTKICLTCTNYFVELLQTFNELKVIQQKLVEVKGKVCERLSSSYALSHCQQELCQVTKNTRDELVEELSNLGIIKINSFTSKPLVQPQVIDINKSEIKTEPNDDEEYQVDSYLEEGTAEEPADDNIEVQRDVNGHPVIPCIYEGCCKTFQCTEMLEAHLRITHFMCIFCKQYFSNGKELNIHKVKTHQKFRCDVKGCWKKFFTILNLTNHMKLHENMAQNVNVKKFECTLCLDRDGQKKSFSSKTSLRNHIQTHSTEYTFKCTTEPDCTYRSKTRQALRNHIRVSHEHRPYKKSKKISKSIVCHECGKTVSEQRYKNHMKTHLPQEQRPRPFACTKCSKSFYEETTLRSHVSFVHNFTGHVCAICGNTVKDIRSHLTQSHGQEKIKCSVCSSSSSRTFKSFAHLRNHMKCHNPNQERNFKCNFDGCSKAFKTQAELNYHNNIHTKEKKQLCPHCDKVFIHPHNLRIHIATLHSDKREFVCEVEGCGESFKIKRYLTLHTKKIHDTLSPSMN